MSAPPLSEARPISDGASFYNPAEAISHPVEATSETGEGMSPPQNNTQGLRGSIPPLGGFEIAVDLPLEDPVQASYIGEDGRFALLREIDNMFRKMAENSSGSSASIPQETLRLLPGILRTLIQFVGELQAKNSQLHMSHAMRQATQENLQAGDLQMEARISSLQRENDLVKDAQRKLESKYDGLVRGIREVERSLENTKAQTDSLRAVLDELKLGATSDSGTERSSKKRRRLE
jgi:hypothetical protein